MTSDFELIGGPEKRAIVLVAYDQQWPARYLSERTTITAALADLPHRLEHVGSTAVPGLRAKPIIDIQLAVPDPDDEASYLEPLRSAGYELRVREAGHRMLRTPAIDVQVHVCPLGSDWERRHLLFRDWLRHSAADRHLYEQAKTELATRDWPSTNHYAEAKSWVIADIMERAEAWAITTPWTQESLPVRRSK